MFGVGENVIEEKDLSIYCQSARLGCDFYMVVLLLVVVLVTNVFIVRTLKSFLLFFFLFAKPQIISPTFPSLSPSLSL